MGGSGVNGFCGQCNGAGEYCTTPVDCCGGYDFANGCGADSKCEAGCAVPWATCSATLRCCSDSTTPFYCDARGQKCMQCKKQHEGCVYTEECCDKEGQLISMSCVNGICTAN